MRIVAALVASMVVGGPVLAAADGPTGTWLTAEGDSKVKIAPCGPTYCATVVWVKPKVPGAEDPHPALAGRDMVGTQLSRDLKRGPNGDLAGTILNPENGKTYDVTVKLKSANTLELGGCVLSVLCGSETWSRAPEDVATAMPKPNSASAAKPAAKAAAATTPASSTAPASAAAPAATQ